MASSLPPDIMLIICEDLANRRDFGTLFNCVRSGKQLAGSALLWLYRIHTQTSIRGGESNEDEMSKTGVFKKTSIAARVAQQRQTVSRWALQWRSIILSSLGKTAYPYCLYIQSLDLRNLEDLLEENIFREHFQTTFFGGDMAPFSFTHDTPMITRTQVKRQKLLPRMNIPAIINAVGESISKFVADLATVSGTAAALEDLSVNIRSDALSRWITRLSRLESMTLWDGAILDGYFGKIIKTHCHNFNSLNIYTCVGDQVDLNLAGFLTAMSNNTLKSLRIFSRNDVGENTFQALNHHHESLVDLVLGNIKPSALKALSSLQGLTALRSLDLNDIGNLINLETTENERFLDILNWVTSCRQLKTIRLQDFMDGPAIMKALCLKDEIHLKALTLSGLGYNLVNNQEFHLSLAHQTSLESLELRADAEECVRDDIDTLVSSLCLLRELRYLNILDTSEYFQSLQIQQLALSLPKLEDLSVSGYGMGDEVWPAISQLHHLKSLSFHSMTSFSFEGILNYISNLQPGNSGLLLSIMNAAIESLLNASEQAFIRDAIAEKVDGRFEFVLYRELESEFDSDSD